MPSTDERLQACISHLTKLEATRNQLAGKLAAAETQLSDIEGECRQRGLDPEKLEAICQQLETTYAGMVAALEKGIETCATDLAQYQDIGSE